MVLESGINLFLPIFSFFFVLLVIYAILDKTKILGESKFIHLLVSFIISIIFISFSSMEFYVRSIIPWFVVLVVIVFMVLFIAGFSTKDFEKMMTPTFSWIIIFVLVVIFLVAAIKVFNPILHPNLIITSGQSPQIISQIIGFLFSSRWSGSVLLLAIAALVSWVITRKS